MTMYNKPIKKTIFTLNIDNYLPEVVALTRPWLEKYAEKIGADIYDITERKFPDMPVVYEKLQIYELAQQIGSDWNIYVDSDALLHPDLIDFTNFLPKNTVMNRAYDMANARWKYDRFFRRDGRNIGVCNWFTIASDECIDLWEPLDDMTLKGALENIYPTNFERSSTYFDESKKSYLEKAVITKEHLIDDYTLSRNIAKYGLKYTTGNKILTDSGLSTDFFYHNYNETAEQKVAALKEIIKKWNLQ